ncbi:MAG TPA: phytanoyl-CoA dioxygenase family protein [Chloroflexota bacterium]
MVPQVTPFSVSNDALDDAPELRRRLDSEGYLFVRKLVDPAPLRDLRVQMLSVLRDGGWLQAGSNLIDGVADVAKKCAEGDPEYIAVYRNVQRLEAFHRMAHAPGILAFMEGVIGETVLPHPAKVARLWFPQNTLHTTPAHQDFVHFQGTYETYTCWMPVGDCPLELGPLAVLAGSHHSGEIYEHHFALGAGGLAVDTAVLPGTWMSTDFAIGDALIFPSRTVHQALPNLTPDRLRVSLDNRYQAQSQPIAEHELVPHLHRVSQQTWEDIYPGWQSADLQYYWKDLSLTVVPSDNSRSNRGFDQALELARQGNELARPLLDRIVKRDPDSSQASAAREALRALNTRMSGRPTS